MSKGPWFITEHQAAAREADIVRQYVADVRRCIVPEMSDDTIRARLASRGWSAAELRFVAVRLEQSHG